MVPQPAIQRLAAGDHAVLSAKKLVNVHRVDARGQAPPRPEAF
ncbi:hypothetical protein G155_00062 [Mycobacterium sp. VKM Ac-1817D]|nr:hypothetical protein G155_00062 [Mycobacterium sp. VKM Ac-1817D]